jgi:very-short-patch-repair endonuclease
VPPAPSASPSDTAAFSALDRHQHRREQAIPTLTVLAGPPGAALSLWRRWLEARGLGLCVSRASHEAGAVRDWMAFLAQHRNLEADAAEVLGAAGGLSPGELASHLQGKTPHERGLLLQELFAAVAPPDTAAACRCLLQPAAAPQEPGDALLEACEQNPLRALAALHSLLPPAGAPALLLAGTGPGWLAQAARTAARMCDAVPTLAAALCVEEEAVDRYLHGEESQGRALVREGRLTLQAVSSEAVKKRVEALGVRDTEALAGAMARLASDGAPDEVLTLYGDAAREREAATVQPEAADRARSEAERFLSALLEALPATRGLFELNQRTGFRIHHRPVEVDLLCRHLRLAIEIDGYYHFQTPEAYRRDRRKDLALQRHGYLVLRFLADDVVARLEEIRDTVLEVVSLRHNALGRVPADGEDADGTDGALSRRGSDAAVVNDSPGGKRLTQ